MNQSPDTSSAPRVALISAVRTPIGAFGGAFKDTGAPALASVAIRHALKLGAVQTHDVQEVIIGNVLQAGLGPNPARSAAVLAGIPYEVPSFTVNKVCGSGLKAVSLAADAIRMGRAEIVVAAGMENMSRAAHLLPGQRWGTKMGAGVIVDSMIRDALWDNFYDCHMGNTAENLARIYSISRDEQDGYAYESQRRYAQANAVGKWGDEMAPVEISVTRGEHLQIGEDEHPRPHVTVEALGKLRASFCDSGTVTPGNASGINDGAAAVVLASERACERRGIQPLAWIGATTSVGVDPMLMGVGPAHAIRRLLSIERLDLRSLDLIEVNEAFAAQVLAVCRELELDLTKVNVNGGAIAIGHPVGASGTRIVVTLVHEMQRRNSRSGLAALCIGGGMGMALALEGT